MVKTQKFEMSVNQFSADRDHETMTGGTLDPVKIIKVLETQYSLFVYHIVMGPFETNPEFHRGSHTLEHYIAYSGGLRDQVKALGADIDSKSILDISPEMYGDAYAIKVSSLTKFDEGQLESVFGKAIELIIPQLENTEVIPFATARQCGQYTYHSKPEALNIANIGKNFSINLEEKDFSNMPYINVCDFRQLKPKLTEGTTEVGQHFLDPHVSHTLWNFADHHWGELWIDDIKISTGVYGCMTGQYVIIASANVITKETLHKVHAWLMALMQRCASEHPDWERMQIDVEMMMKEYTIFWK